MFPDYWLAKELYRERLREAEKQRLIRQTMRSRPHRPFWRSFSMWIRNNLLLKLASKMHYPAAKDQASNNFPV